MTSECNIERYGLFGPGCANRSGCVGGSETKGCLRFGRVESRLRVQGLSAVRRGLMDTATVDPCR